MFIKKKAANYSKAVAFMQSTLDALIADQDFTSMDQKMSEIADLPLTSSMALGTGFGYLETLRMGVDLYGPAVPLTNSADPAISAWVRKKK